jgi:hypothetical protein
MRTVRFLLPAQLVLPGCVQGPMSTPPTGTPAPAPAASIAGPAASPARPIADPAASGT